MGKGKRLKKSTRKTSEIKVGVNVSDVFGQANKFAQSMLPDYDEARFVKEFQESGDKFSVLRYWMYIQLGIDPNGVDKRADDIIQYALKNNGCVVQDGVVIKEEK